MIYQNKDNNFKNHRQNDYALGDNSFKILQKSHNTLHDDYNNQTPMKE